MSEEVENKGLSQDERDVNKVVYAGKRIYGLLCEMKREIASAGDLGILSELDIDTLIAAAREIGQVPVWNAEDTKPTRKLTYPKGTTGVVNP